MREERPPIAIEVHDLTNLARLATSRVDVQPLFWSFKHRGQSILGSLISIPYWRGSLPIFAHIRSPRDLEVKGYIGYTNLGVEKAFFAESADDTRYVYGPVIEVEAPPKLLTRALTSRSMLRVKPISVRAKNLSSLLRVLLIMSDNASSPPIWHHEASEGKHVLGVVAPFYDYYDANALPVFFYVEVDEAPAPFIKYQAVGGKEILGYAQSISDMKHFYGRVITVKNLPFLKPRRKKR